MSKTFIVFIVLILLVIGVYAFNKMQSPAASPPVSTVPSVTSAPPSVQNPSGTQQKFAAVITYTDSGFTPNSVTIKNGETVEWVNNSSASMWVASNPHPTHTDYPGFDELKTVPNGGTYQFTFTKVGNWGYHNHRNPSDGGTVNVQ